MVLCDALTSLVQEKELQENPLGSSVGLARLRLNSPRIYHQVGEGKDEGGIAQPRQPEPIVHFV